MRHTRRADFATSASRSIPASGSGVSAIQDRTPGRIARITFARREPPDVIAVTASGRAGAGRSRARRGARSASSSGHRDRDGRRGGEGLHQRPVEETLVDRPDDTSRLRPCVLERLERRARGFVREAERPRARCSRLASDVGSVCVCRPASSCRRCSTWRRNTYASTRSAASSSARRSLRRQQVERVERRPDAQLRVVTSVDELQELHRELDVADAAAAELHLPAREAAACRSRARRVDLRRGSARSPPAPSGPARRTARSSEERTPELAVTRREAALDQRLELPDLRPARVVLAVRVERADERPVPALADADRRPTRNRTGGPFITSITSRARARGVVRRRRRVTNSTSMSDA